MLYYHLINLNGKDLKLRLNIENCVYLEKELNKNPYDVLTNIISFKARIKEIKLILKYSLKEYHSDLSVNDIYEELCDSGHDMISIGSILIEVFKEAGFFDSYDEESIENEKDNSKKVYSERNEENPTLNTLFFNLLENALYFGISEKEYWTMTYGEVIRAIKAKSKKEKDDFKARLTADYSLANLMASSLSRLFSKDAEMPSLYECYPELFAKEAEEERKRKEESFEEDFFKALDDWELHYNAQRNRTN